MLFIIFVISRLTSFTRKLAPTSPHITQLKIFQASAMFRVTSAAAYCKYEFALFSVGISIDLLTRVYLFLGHNVYIAQLELDCTYVESIPVILRFRDHKNNFL